MTGAWNQSNEPNYQYYLRRRRFFLFRAGIKTCRIPRMRMSSKPLWTLLPKMGCCYSRGVSTFSLRSKGIPVLQLPAPHVFWPIQEVSLAPPEDADLAKTILSRWINQQRLMAHQTKLAQGFGMLSLLISIVAACVLHRIHILLVLVASELFHLLHYSIPLRNLSTDK